MSVNSPITSSPTRVSAVSFGDASDTLAQETFGRDTLLPSAARDDVSNESASRAASVAPESTVSESSSGSIGDPRRGNSASNPVSTGTPKSPTSISPTSTSSLLAPSEELVRTLTELQLCRPADIQAARSWVRRLARDIPAFDSVWIDALVRMRRLTPFQARLLDQREPSQLRVASYVLIDELGQGPRSATFLARPVDGRERCVVKRIRVVEESAQEARRRLRRLIEQTSSWSHPNLVVPRSVPPWGDERELAVVSPLVSGIPLSELLVRRGRFPAAVVLEIGRQLLEGLSALDARGLVHGDIRLSNVRLTDAGTVVLVDGGIRPALHPELTIHDSFSLAGYDGIAPELIGTGQSANAQSELYGLGCLLWQLLAGRPPYPMADPLVKLAAHQTQRIRDVREWAPDTPANLAEAIWSMTSPRPSERPASFGELLQRWGHSGLSGRSLLRRHRRLFDGAVPHLSQGQTVTSLSKPFWIGAALLLGGVGVCSVVQHEPMRKSWTFVAQTIFRDRNLAPTGDSPDQVPAGTDDQNRVELAHSGSHRQEKPQTASNELAGNAAGLSGSTTKSLPRPTANGDIVLTDAGPYHVGRLQAVSALTIRAASGIRPVLVVSGEPISLQADSVTLRDLIIRRDAAVDVAPVRAMLLVTARHLSLKGCELELPAGGLISPDESRTPLLAWKTQDSSAKNSGHVEIEQTTFRGPGTALHCAEAPQLIRLSNCLKVGAGPCLMLLGQSGVKPQPVRVQLNHVTLRDTGPLVRFGGSFAEQTSAVIPVGTNGASSLIGITAQDCLFDVASQTGGLLEAVSDTVRDELVNVFQWNGNGSVITPGRNLMSVIDPTRRGEPTPLEADDRFEGLVAGDVEYKGQASGPFSASKLDRTTAPRSSQATALPGIR